MAGAGRGGRGRYRVLGPTERAAVRARFRMGGSLREVMADFGLAKSSAWGIGREAALMGRRVEHSPRRLSFEERERISQGIAAGESARAIARGLGRAPSTVCREIARCGGQRERYRALAGERVAERLARRPTPTKLAACPELSAEVERGLEQGWSPQQISARLQITFPDDLRMRISHETIPRFNRSSQQCLSKGLYLSWVTDAERRADWWRSAE